VVHKIRVKDSQSLAIRHMLGNKKIVPKSAHGLPVSQSTIRINKIQDVFYLISEFELCRNNDEK